VVVQRQARAAEIKAITRRWDAVSAAWDGMERPPLSRLEILDRRQNKRDVVACLEELIDNDLEEFARP
jgi:hypothetical protein